MLSNLAHVKWFSEGDSSATLGSLTYTQWGVVVAAVVAGVLLMIIVNKLMEPLDSVLDKKFAGLRDWIPTAVRWSTALLIIFNFWKGYLVAPNIVVGNETLHLIINAVLIGVALLLLLGAYTRVAGLLLLGVFALGTLAAAEPLQLLDHLEYVGISLFLMFAGSGKLSVKAKLNDPLSPLSKNEWLASPLLRTFVGLGLVVLAFSEKLLNLTLSNDFLQNNSWNFLSSFGVDDRNFIILAGVVELLAGLTLVLNKVPRLGTLAVLCLMIITAAILGLEEVFGHLFAVGVVVAVWIGPNENLPNLMRSRTAAKHTK